MKEVEKKKRNGFYQLNQLHELCKRRKPCESRKGSKVHERNAPPHATHPQVSKHSQGVTGQARSRAGNHTGSCTFHNKVTFLEGQPTFPHVSPSTGKQLCLQRALFSSCARARFRDYTELTKEEVNDLVCH
ncbi:hypothetical protein C922_03073 [Plasmodium inui San Antonio 1]|uniref:Uncharacterized protein n=1 Tax=Plasmodium inui San Antonio 1 TaxID=1237626 RepID=W7ABG1_9APIC|nr:hypothetical protein C922_03073 [Plasmodium inui San Antonio 1]EUD66439.1 hypothetical protein C922_03073 [Plasmodium inui San Antonio 1]